MAVKIVFCYAHEDEKMLIQLKKHLTALQKNGFIETWHDRDISAGVEWELEIDRQINNAHIILLLISKDFIASNYCYSKEMKIALERHERGGARVIPIILRPVTWQYESFSKLQVLPTKGKPITRWSVRDEAFVDITEGIAEVIRDLSIWDEQIERKYSILLCDGEHKSNIYKKQALLVLAGERALADILTLLYFRPQLVVIIMPQQGWQFQKTFVDIAERLPSCEVKIIPGINAFDIDACIKACTEAWLPYSGTEWEWIFTASSAAKVMSLAGYEFAKQKGIPCLQIDILHRKVISLVKEVEVDTRRFFYLTVDEYMSHYGYTVAYTSKGLADQSHQRKLIAWSDVARELIDSPDTEFILCQLRHRRVGEKFSLSPELQTSALLQSLEKNGLLEITIDETDEMPVCCFSSHDSTQFLAGDWLVYYVWHEIIKVGFADDCQWGFSVIINKQTVFEIDIALTYNTQLLVVECCTSQNVFRQANHLTKLDSIAYLVGGSYVNKVLVTNQLRTGDSYKSFYEQANLRKIIVVTKEDLPNVGSILKREMVTPTYLKL